MHPEAFAYVARTTEEFGPFKSVVDLGGRNVNGSIKDLFVGARFFAVDIIPGIGVDAVADAADWVPGPDNRFDCVVTTETLEHTHRGEEIVHNAAKILASSGGGRFIMTTASSPRMPHSGVDGGPLRNGEYYSNVEPCSIIKWMTDAGFTDIKVEKALAAHGGDLYATGLVLVDSA